MPPADIRVAPHVRQHLAERVGPLPRGGERADRSRADPPNDAVDGVGGQFQLAAHFRQQFFEEEAGILIAESVVFEAAIRTGLLSLDCGGNLPGVDEHRDGDWDRSLVNQVVEDDGGTKLPLRIDIGAAILQNQQRGGLSPLVLLRDVHPEVPLGSRKDLLTHPPLLGDGPLGYARLTLRVGAEHVVVGGPGCCHREHSQGQQPHRGSEEPPTPGEGSGRELRHHDTWRAGEGGGDKVVRTAVADSQPKRTTKGPGIARPNDTLSPRRCRGNCYPQGILTLRGSA